MVARDSQAANFNTGNSPSIQQSSVGFMQPDTDKYRESGSIDLLNGDVGSTSRVLNNLLSVSSKLADQAFEQSKQEAMLSGVAAANTGKAESELQGDPLTRDWAVAGYRDTTARLKMADQQAQIAVDMKRMREKSPEEFGDYLAEKRTEMESAYSGMTLDGRKAMVTQQAMNDRANIAKHQTEHAQFIIDTENRSVAAGAQTQYSALDSAKSNAKLYNETTDSAMAFAVGQLAMNPKLPVEVRSKLIGEYAERALNGDHQALFLRMQRENVELPDGTSMPLLSSIPMNEQTKLSGMYRESLKRTEAARNVDYMQQMATMRAGWRDINTPLPEPAEVLGFLRDGVSKGIIQTDERYESIYQEYLQEAAKRGNQGAVAAAYATGNSGAMLSHNKTQSEALDAWMATTGKSLTVPQAAGALLDIGINTGQETAFRKVGELLAPAFVQLGLRDNIDPQQAAGLAGILQRIDQAAGAGQSGAMSQFLSALSPEAQAKVEYMRENLRNRMDPVSAIVDAGSKALEESKMTPAMRSSLASARATDINKAMDELTPMGTFGVVSTWAKSFFSDNASQELKLRARDWWFTKEDQAQQVMFSTKQEILKSMTRISASNPSLSIDSIRNKAYADVGNRTVDTKWGPLTVPAETSPQKYFGVDAQVPNDRIGSALTEFWKPKDNGRLSFSMGLQGQLVVRELDKNGEILRTDTVDPRAVGDVVRKQQKEMGAHADAVWGRGITSQGITFNGQNNGNADPEWALDWRKGVLDKGIAVVNGSSPEASMQASLAFQSDSNKAMAYGQRMMNASGKNNQAAFDLFSTVALVDDSFDKSNTYRNVLRAVKIGDSTSAMAALRSTPMYKGKAADKQQYYERLLQDAMKGQ